MSRMSNNIVATSPSPLLNPITLGQKMSFDLIHFCSVEMVTTKSLLIIIPVLHLLQCDAKIFTSYFAEVYPGVHSSKLFESPSGNKTEVVSAIIFILWKPASDIKI